MDQRDSTPTRPSERVKRYREASRQLWSNPANKKQQDALGALERDLTENDWKWIRGEWH